MQGKDKKKYRILSVHLSTCEGTSLSDNIQHINYLFIRIFNTFSVERSNDDYIIPPPMLAILAAASAKASSFFASTTHASVVRSIAEAEAAF